MCTTNSTVNKAGAGLTCYYLLDTRQGNIMISKEPVDNLEPLRKEQQHSRFFTKLRGEKSRKMMTARGPAFCLGLLGSLSGFKRNVPFQCSVKSSLIINNA